MSFEKKDIIPSYRYASSSPGHTEALAYTGGEIDGAPADYHERDVFGYEGDAQIKYKTLSWQMVAVLMIAEIVSNGTV
jgi:hypothetical protein